MTSRQSKHGRPPLWKVWYTAARPHTLTASIAPNIVSYNACLAHIPDPPEGTGAFLSLALQWTAFCMLIQLGTNLHNDYADFVRGADNDKRVGQPRATQRGWLTPRQTATASGLTLLGASLLGASLLRRMLLTGAGTGRLALAAFVVASSVFNAFAYTGGPWPLGYLGMPTLSIGYSGLGDLFVFLYFGLVATLMPPLLYVSTTGVTATGSGAGDGELLLLRTLLRTVAPYSVQVAALATNIIVVNNLRDRHTDVLAGKKTLAVRFGATFCRLEYGAMLLLAYGLVGWDFVFRAPHGVGVGGSIPALRLLPLLSVPLAWNEWRALYTKEGSALNQHVGGAAKVQFLFCILLAISTRLST